jgi:hypothetical protein
LTELDAADVSATTREPPRGKIAALTAVFGQVGSQSRTPVAFASGNHACRFMHVTFVNAITHACRFCQWQSRMSLLPAPVVSANAITHVTFANGNHACHFCQWQSRMSLLLTQSRMSLCQWQSRMSLLLTQSRMSLLPVAITHVASADHYLPSPIKHSLTPWYLFELILNT